MGIGDSVGEGVGCRSSVAFIVGGISAVGISVGEIVKTTADVGADSGVGKLDVGLELHALIPKSMTTIKALWIFISFLNNLIAA